MGSAKNGFFAVRATDTHEPPMAIIPGRLSYSAKLQLIAAIRLELRTLSYDVCNIKSQMDGTNGDYSTETITCLDRIDDIEAKIQKL